VCEKKIAALDYSREGIPMEDLEALLRGWRLESILKDD